ncbi:hypothetical protein V6N13_115197 [Hibiscus sabdariffa]|uniref:Protein kinase domain-containing protein n=1 Tax=Hibiscus sabdariffa TaxID=183260 RepID=A0ABR2CTE7_9ROSI
MPCDQKKNVLVGIRFDNQSRDLLNWAIVKVAEPGDCVVAVHVSPSSDHALGQKLLERYLEVYGGLCSIKKVDLKGQICKGRSIRKVLIREVVNYDAVALVVGTDKLGTLGGWTSTARYCMKRLPMTTNVLAINNGKLVFERFNNSELPGLKGDPRPSLCLSEHLGVRECQSEYGKRIITSRSVPLFAGDNLDYQPGWPLLLRASSATSQAKHARSLSVVNWVMNLPSRSLHDHTPRCSTIKEIELSEIEDDNHGTGTNSSMQYELQKCLDILLKKSSSDCQWYSYEILKDATDQFSTENLIGKGGSNRVFKGILPDGREVAVKILKSSEEACKDFANEIEIISSLKHKHIMPLIGVCIKDRDLISVYDFSSKGSLEEILHGNSKGKHALSWELRYNIAVGIAEGLNYMHNALSRPVIHRDVKSSNILLSDGFEPKLSDFGLAIWGPTDSSFLIQADVVGTFGYLAPEYFMYGKISDKIDVYAFGVVLLELLSGNRPISFENPKGQQSLVMWAKPIIESGDVKGILDPKLNGNINETQMNRMVQAATLCITQSARLRPKMSQILELLKGEKAVEKWAETENENTESQEHHTDDEVYPNSRPELHLSVAMLEVDDDSTSFCSMEQGGCSFHLLWSFSPVQNRELIFYSIDLSGISILMEDGELDFSNQQVFPVNNMGEIPSSCSMDSFFDELLDDSHACTHTHTCNPPGPDNSHTHTCFHFHTKIVPASSEDKDVVDDTTESREKKSKKRPLGNREAVRKYREKVKARAASLEDEVERLRAVNQQLLKRLQGQAALEAEVARLKCLLVDVRGRIEGEIGSFPYQKPATNVNMMNDSGGAYVMNPCNVQCNDQMYCLHPGVEDKSGEAAVLNGQGFNGCDFDNIQCLGNQNSGAYELSTGGVRIAGSNGNSSSTKGRKATAS